MVGHNEAETVGATLASVWGTYPRMEILVVDDEPGMLMVTKAVLESLGHEPVLVASGEEALDKRDGFSVAAGLTLQRDAHGVE